MIEYWSEHQVEKHSDSYQFYASISPASDINLYWMQDALLFVIFLIILMCEPLNKLCFMSRYCSECFNKPLYFLEQASTIDQLECNWR